MRESGLKGIGSLWEGLSYAVPRIALQREERLWVAEEVWASVGQAEVGGPSPGIRGKETEEQFFSRESGHVSDPVSCSGY